jgi:hypothetical protein
MSALVATMIVPMWAESRIRELTTASSGSTTAGQRLSWSVGIIMEPRLPAHLLLTSPKILVHGSMEYEALLAEALGSEPQHNPTNKGSTQ